MDADGGHDGTDGPDGSNRTRRRALRTGGSLAGILSMLGASGPTGAAGTSEEEGEAQPVCENVDPATDPNEWYRQLVADQLDLRDSTEPALDANRDDVRAVLREHNGEFDGHLLFFASSDFGQPRVFLPEELSDRDAALRAVLDRIHERRWREENLDLRDVRARVFEEVDGIHKGVPALYHGDGAEYDVTAPREGVYNFTAITQLVGLVDWMSNADDRWNRNHRNPY